MHIRMFLTPFPKFYSHLVKLLTIIQIITSKADLNILFSVSYNNVPSINFLKISNPLDHSLKSTLLVNSKSLKILKVSELLEIYYTNFSHKHWETPWKDKRQYFFFLFYFATGKQKGQRSTKFPPEKGVNRDRGLIKGRHVPRHGVSRCVSHRKLGE
ncbi:UNVERIFIED_CONTAM: hypothetical protein RMT77_001185 [Armadillidium vulgare]